ncbi:putative transcription factor bHLH041 isoform X2 [Daucus carota subsp. sativus]|uniref:putative transcription factor bHLH041 isoform X2 n=1 Tax=Daucus carota subsp. sativus TaxID=79200 RepID=UPI0007EFB8AF|nr:PREDICTED: putative transcription factor bHLH041 isoform X2 [Daucus carota subsp. sativus]
MDSIFQLSGDARVAFLHQISQTFGCTYICLWTYLPLPSNCLVFTDGIHHEETNQSGLSSGITRAMRLFSEYRKSVIMIDNGVPGLAFKNNLPYIEIKENDLQAVASTQTQLQFYQEARIKTAIYMGCKSGEIELGMSINNQVNIELEMRTLFPDDFLRQAIPRELSQPNDQNPHSSSSSSMRSLSIDSPEGTPSNFLYNISNNTSTSYNISEPPSLPSSQAFMGQIRSVHQFPAAIDREDAAMTHAMLAVISSSSPASSTSSHQPLQNASAFKSYRSALSTTSQITSRVHRQNMLKRAIAFCRSNANLMPSSQEQTIQYANRPTSNQMHHMISERKRREKLNESFQALRTLLPPGSKKDKASLLSNTTEYITTLKAEVEELTRKNQTLEAQILQGSTNDQDLLMASAFLADQSHHVWISNSSESTSEGRNLSVIVKGDYCSMLDLSIQVVEFLKQLRYVSLLSLQADMQMVEATSLIRLVFRLKIEEGSKWDEMGFQEAVKNVVADIAR